MQQLRDDLEKAAQRFERIAEQWARLSEGSDEEIAEAVRATAPSMAGSCRRYAEAARKAANENA